jgi:ATP-dependent Lon protease
MDNIEIPRVLPILPLRDAVVFPRTVTGIVVGQERSMMLIEDVQKTNKLLGLAAQRNRDAVPAFFEDLFQVGTAAMIHNVVRGADGVLRVFIEGIERIRTLERLENEPYPKARVELYPPTPIDPLEGEALARSIRDEISKLAKTEMQDPGSLMQNVRDPLQLVYVIASTYPFSTEDRQSILECRSLREMMMRLLSQLQREVSVAELKASLTEQTREKISREQREYVLREQLETIKKQLGERDGEEGTVMQLAAELARIDLPEEARSEVDRELHRLERTPSASPEHAIIRTYLEWVRDLPWNSPSGAPIDVMRAREVLDADHYDLDRVKDRILEYLAVRKLRAERSAPASVGSAREPILCLVGPPGVGKTSLGQSVARALGRELVRVSLGGVHDEAEIRGHRRTYIGAMPGRIIQALRRLERSDPIFMLDEVDKLSIGFHGDPSAALLEVLDPAQNSTFVDSYLSVSFDLSKVLFMCTANTTESIPAPLLDRMEILRLPGYTDREKLEIARRFLLPKLIDMHGLRPDEVQIESGALGRAIREYTREAGVRNLERVLAEVLRKIARRISEGQRGPMTVDDAALHELLGPPRFLDDVAERIDRPGIATGLAWTPFGGEILFVEAAMMRGRGEQLILTGMLGDVMRESARAALSYLRSSASRLGVDPRTFDRKVVHIHVPAGAIPKDGPSAGVAMLAALASLVLDRSVDSRTGMTGEITLRGKILPVGGIKEKVLAAHRAGLERIVLPKRNETALEDIPDEVKRALQFVLVDSADDALDAVLGSVCGRARSEQGWRPPPLPSPGDGGVPIPYDS